MTCWRCHGRTCHGRVKRRKAGKCSSSTTIRSGNSGHRARWRPRRPARRRAPTSSSSSNPGAPWCSQGAEQQVETSQIVAVVPAADFQRQGRCPLSPRSVRLTLCCSSLPAALPLCRASLRLVRRRVLCGADGRIPVVVAPRHLFLLMHPIVASGVPSIESPSSSQAGRPRAAPPAGCPPPRPPRRPRTAGSRPT